MFTAALFTIAKIWKQPKCPSAGYGQIVIHHLNGIQLSNEKGINYQCIQQPG